MKRQAQLILIVGALLTAACAPLQTHTMEPNTRVQVDHEALAPHYGQEARKAQEKLDEYRKMLGDRTGLTAKGFINQLNYLVRINEKAVKENRALAEWHRQQQAVAKK